jgi:hypothetical protein
MKSLNPKFIERLFAIVQEAEIKAGVVRTLPTMYDLGFRDACREIKDIFAATHPEDMPHIGPAQEIEEFKQWEVVR